VISTAADSPRSISDNCSKLSQKIIARARRLGISPTAFARYLSLDAQQSERNAPFITYVDDHEEIATRTAGEISELWQVPVKGLTFGELKTAIAKGTSIQKILINHVMYEYARTLVSSRKISVIPVEVRISEQTTRLLSEIKANSSVLLIHLPHPAHRVHFMVAQMRKVVTSPGVKIFSTSVRKVSSLSELLNSARYDYYLIGPAVRGAVPHELRQNPRILQINPQLDPASLEAARIHAGVVI
jgi:hypothetical protein